MDAFAFSKLLVFFSFFFFYTSSACLAIRCLHAVCSAAAAAANVSHLCDSLSSVKKKKKKSPPTAVDTTRPPLAQKHTRVTYNRRMFTDALSRGAQSLRRMRPVTPSSNCLASYRPLPFLRAVFQSLARPIFTDAELPSEHLHGSAKEIDAEPRAPPRRSVSAVRVDLELLLEIFNGRDQIGWSVMIFFG